MMPRERVLAAVRHQAPDRFPMDFGGTEFAGCNAGFLARLREILALASRILPPCSSERYAHPQLEPFALFTSV